MKTNHSYFFLLGDLKRAGAQRVAVTVAKKLNNSGYNIKIITLSDKIEHEHDGVEVITLTNRYYRNKLTRLFYAYLNLLKYIREYRPNAIVGFLRDVNILLFFTFFRRQVYRIAINPFKTYVWYDKYVVATLYRLYFIKKIISPSVRMANDLQKKYKFKKMYPIHNPVNIQYYRSSVNGRESPIYGKYIIAVGRLTKQKRYDIILKAFHQASLPQDVKLVILGEGKEENNIKQLVRDLNISSRVEMVGNVSNPYVYMKHALFMIHAADFEGFANVLVESLACGVPVISTDCEYGPSEIIKNNENGVLVKVGDVDAMADAISKLYFDKNYYSNIKSNTIQSVEKFNIDAISREWEKLLLSL